MRRLYKVPFVIFGSIIFSTIAIQASDIVQNINGRVLQNRVQIVCPKDSVLVYLSDGAVCVDIYEASPSAECPITSPESKSDTQRNLNNVACSAVSEKDRMPWRFVSLIQAQQLCARAQKHVPTNDQWYALVMTMSTQEGCRINSADPAKTGVSKCVTQSGISDMVGNVWEWVDAEVVNGVYNNRVLPESGFIHLVDTNGIVLQTKKYPSTEYGDDYALTKAEGVFGVIRGGFYGSGTDAGIFAQNLAVPLNLKTEGIGFRCIRNL